MLKLIRWGKLIRLGMIIKYLLFTVAGSQSHFYLKNVSALI